MLVTIDTPFFSQHNDDFGVLWIKMSANTTSMLFVDTEGRGAGGVFLIKPANTATGKTAKDDANRIDVCWAPSQIWVRYAQLGAPIYLVKEREKAYVAQPFMVVSNIGYVSGTLGIRREGQTAVEYWSMRLNGNGEDNMMLVRPYYDGKNGYSSKGVGSVVSSSYVTPVSRSYELDNSMDIKEIKELVDKAMGSLRPYKEENYKLVVASTYRTGFNNYDGDHRYQRGAVGMNENSVCWD